MKTATPTRMSGDPTTTHETPLKNPELSKTGNEDGNAKPELNAPELDEKTGKPTVKAIETAKQAHAIAKSLKQNAMNQDGRLALAGQIASLYNGKQPFDPRALQDDGQDWRANCSTGFLPSIVDRVTPQMRDPIFRADLLTHSTLPPEIPRSSEKSRKFCEDTTKLVRGWRGWNDHVSLLTQDICLHGGGTPGHIGRDWRPRLFRPDQCFLFDGAEQHASRQQVVVFWQAMMIHDFLELFDDHKAAEMAGYDVQECIKAANYCSGKQTADSQKTPLEFEDAIREKGRIGYSAENQARTVNLFHVFWREYDGTVSLRTVTEENGYGVRSVENCEEEMGIENMEDVITLFTLQVGNGKFYGSKGLGRLLANIHICVERGRCLAIDQVYLAGLLVLMCEAGDIKNLKPSVNHPFIILQGKAQIAKEQITFSATDWKMLDDMLVGIAENVAGAFLPPNLTTAGAANTKIEAAQKAEREIAVRQGVLGRFFAQFADLMGCIQRRVYSDDNMKEGLRIFKKRQVSKGKGIMPLASRLWNRLRSIMGKDFKEDTSKSPETAIADPEAVDVIVGLLDFGLTVQEIVQLAMSPAGNDVQSNSSERDAATMEFLQNPENLMDPQYNKKEMAKMRATIAIGQDRATQLQQKDTPDPNDAALNQRQQTIEFTEMMAGEDMPVAIATDNHLIHRKTLAPKMGMLVGVLEKAVKGGLPMEPAIVASAQRILQHYADHLKVDKDTPAERMNAEVQVIQAYGGIIEAAQKMVEQQAKEAEARAQAGQGGGSGDGAAPSGAPVGPNGQNAPGGPPEGQGPQMHPSEVAGQHIDNAVKLADTAHRQSLDERRLALEEKKHEHQVDMDTIGAATSTLDTIEKMAQSARAAGEKDAEKSFNQTPGTGGGTPNAPKVD